MPKAMTRKEMIAELTDHWPISQRQAARTMYSRKTDSELADLIGDRAYANACPKPAAFSPRDHYVSDTGKCLNCGEQIAQ